MLRQHLAQFDAPLIEGVDLPDGALGKDGVLVERDQFAQGLRRQPFRQKYVRGAVAFKHAMRHQPVRRSLRLDLLRGLAESQGLGLGKDVGQQHVVMAAQAD